MKRTLVLLSVALLAGCASDGYYTGYSSYGYYDGYAPYYGDGYRPYVDEPGWPVYRYYGWPGFFGGGIVYDDEWRHDRHRGHRPRAPERVERAPSETVPPGNVVRPGAGRRVPSGGASRPPGEPSSGMTIEESLGAAGR